MSDGPQGLIEFAIIALLVLIVVTAALSRRVHRAAPVSVALPRIFASPRRIVLAKP